MTAMASTINATHETPDSYHETSGSYADYLKGAICETVSGLTDESILKYIHTMLMNAVTAVEMQQEGC